MGSKNIIGIVLEDSKTIKHSYLRKVEGRKRRVRVWFHRESFGESVLCQLDSW